MAEEFGKKLNYEEILELDGKYVGPTQGVSMRPMLKSGRDTVVIVKKTERLKALDVAFYRRGEKYVLHRVIEPIDGGYLIRGDNCYSDELIPEENVLGVLDEYFCGDVLVKCTDKKYLAYAKRRVKNYPVRRFFVRVKWKTKRILHAVFKRKNGSERKD